MCDFCELIDSERLKDFNATEVFIFLNFHLSYIKKQYFSTSGRAPCAALIIHELSPLTVNLKYFWSIIQFNVLLNLFHNSGSRYLSVLVTF